MTDLKTANEQLTEAIAALESNEHEADVREAEALRLRLMELDAKTGARIRAKLEAHKAIALAWKEELLAPGQKVIGAPSVQDDAFGVVENQSLSMKAAALTAKFNQEPTDFTADAWTAHHDAHTGKYALSGEEIPDPVLVNGVAEMQQAAVSDEQ